MSGRRHAKAKVANCLVQVDELLGRLLLNTSSCNGGGMTVGMGEACGLRDKKECKRFLESASTEPF